MIEHRLLEVMLSHPAASESLLFVAADAIASGALPGYLRPAILSNPTSTPVVLDVALPEPKQLSDFDVQAICTRSGPLPDRARDLLVAAEHRARVIGALTRAEARTLGALVERADADLATRDTIVPAVIDAPATTLEHARALAGSLARDPQPIPAARTWLRSLLARRTPAQGADLVEHLLAAGAADIVAEDLQRMRAPLERRKLVATLLADGARSNGTPQAWLAALEGNRDLDGTVATAALESGAEPGTLRSIVRSGDVPIDVRRTAWVALLKHESALTPSDVDEHFGALLRGAGPRFLHTCADGPLTTDRLWLLLQCRDLPSAAVVACQQWAARREWVIGGDVLSIAMATHPAAPMAVRDWARHMGEPSTPSPEPGSLYETLTTAGVLAARVGARAAGADLPVWAAAENVDCYPGVVAMREAALGELLPRVQDRTAAHTVLALIEQFTGTLRELFDVATTVAA